MELPSLDTICSGRSNNDCHSVDVRQIEKKNELQQQCVMSMRQPVSCHWKMLPRMHARAPRGGGRGLGRGVRSRRFGYIMVWRCSSSYSTCSKIGQTSLHAYSFCLARAADITVDMHKPARYVSFASVKNMIPATVDLPLTTSCVSITVHSLPHHEEESQMKCWDLRAKLPL